MGPIVISPDGRFVVSGIYSRTTNSLVVFDRRAATNWFLPDYRPANNFPIQFTADSRSFTYVGAPLIPPNAATQVFRYDLEARQDTLVSTAFNSTAPGNDDSDSPSVSPDGRFIAYRSSASDLVPGDTNNMADIFVYDRYVGTTMLLTTSRFGPFPAFGRSSEPMFSADGQWLFLQSFAADLVASDFNNRADIFAYRMASLSPIPLFLAQIIPSSEGISLTWPLISGKTYRVQFKSTLADEQWQDATGTVTISGTQGSFHELPSATHRFYRVVAF